MLTKTACSLIRKYACMNKRALDFEPFWRFSGSSAASTALPPILSSGAGSTAQAIGSAQSSNGNSSGGSSNAAAGSALSTSGTASAPIGSVGSVVGNAGRASASSSGEGNSRAFTEGVENAAEKAANVLKNIGIGREQLQDIRKFLESIE